MTAQNVTDTQTGVHAHQFTHMSKHTHNTADTSAHLHSHTKLKE